MVNLWLPQFNYSNHVFCGKTMVNLWLPEFNYSNHVFFVVKPWLICGYHSLTIVTMFFFVVKPWLICGYHSLTIVTMFFLW